MLYIPKTQAQRDRLDSRHAAKRARKTARTAIYRALYGEGGRSYNIPWLDFDRRLPQGWNAAAIRDIVDEHLQLAAFSPETLTTIRQRLEQLERSK